MTLKELIKKQRERFSYKYGEFAFSEVVRKDGHDNLIASLSVAQKELLEAIIQEVEGMVDKGDYTGEGWPRETEVEKDGWNAALDDVIQKLKDL